MSVFKETKYDCLSRDLLHLSLKSFTMTVFKENYYDCLLFFFFFSETAEKATLWES